MPRLALTVLAAVSLMTAAAFAQPMPTASGPSAQTDAPAPVVLADCSVKKKHSV